MKVRLDHEQGLVEADSDVRYSMVIRSSEDLHDVRIGQIVTTDDGRPVGYSMSELPMDLREGETVEWEVILPSPSLAPGRYFLRLSLALGDNATGLVDLDVVLESVHFEVVPAVTDSGRVTYWNELWGPVRFEDAQVAKSDRALQV